MVNRLPFTILLVGISIAIIVLTMRFMSSDIERDIKAKYLKAGDFDLLHEGKAFSLGQLRGHPVILYFGYTYCPDVCPVGLSKIRDVLSSHEDFKDVPALFITVDPHRDDDKRLKEYTGFFHPNIIPLSGSVEQITSVSSAYGTFFRSGREKAGEGNSYTVDHSAFVYLLDDQGRLMRVLDHDVQAEQISELLHKLL